MRRCAVGEESHLLHAALFQGFLREAQVTVVDGVERPPKDADRCDAHCLQCQTTHVSQHMRKVGGEARSSSAVDHTMVV